jgi:hypothetical protein
MKKIMSFLSWRRAPSPIHLPHLLSVNMSVVGEEEEEGGVVVGEEEGGEGGSL